MTKSRSTKNALISSILVLALCFSMLLGTTFAWFTDTAASNDNKVVSGTLDVELWQHTGTGENDKVNISDSHDALFTDDILWEPNRTEVVYLSIKNNGSLALKYKVAIDVSVDSSVDLTEVMEYDIIENAQYGSVTAWADEGTAVVPGTNATQANDVELLPEAVHYFALAVHMDKDAGNKYQGQSISFDIKVLAGQATEESGAFGDGYDADATYPNVSASVTVPADTTQSITLSANGMSVEVPVSALPTSTTSVFLVYSTPSIDVTNNTVNYSSVELVDQNGDVIDLEGNTEAIAVTLPAQTAFAAGEIVYIYHDGEYVDMATVAADGTISYEAAHFCEVVVSKEYNGEYVEVSDSNSFANGGAFKLTNDIAADNGITIPTGVTTIVDLNGYTINAEGQFISNGGNLIIKGTGVINAKQINNQWDEENAVTLTLEKGVTLNTSGSLYAINNDEETIVINGATINHSGSNYAIINYGTTTINDATISSSTGVIENVMGTTTINDGTFTHSGSMYSVIHQMYDGETIINGGTFIQNGSDPLANVEYGGKLTVNGGTFDATSMFCGSDDVTVNAGVFKNNATIVDYIKNISSIVAATSTATTNDDDSVTVAAN